MKGVVNRSSILVFRSRTVPLYSAHMNVWELSGGFQASLGAWVRFLREGILGNRNVRLLPTQCNLLRDPLIHLYHQFGSRLPHLRFSVFSCKELPNFLSHPRASKPLAHPWPPPPIIPPRES